jgi:hypothetical protein
MKPIKGAIMPDAFLQVKDMLASATADCDQCQALIDEARSLWPEDLVLQKQLDEKQLQLDLRRTRIKIFKDIADIVEP